LQQWPACTAVFGGPWIYAGGRSTLAALEQTGTETSTTKKCGTDYWSLTTGEDRESKLIEYLQDTRVKATKLHLQ